MPDEVVPSQVCNDIYAQLNADTNQAAAQEADRAARIAQASATARKQAEGQPAPKSDEVPADTEIKTGFVSDAGAEQQRSVTYPLGESDTVSASHRERALNMLDVLCGKPPAYPWIEDFIAEVKAGKHPGWGIETFEPAVAPPPPIPAQPPADMRKGNTVDDLSDGEPSADDPDDLAEWRHLVLTANLKVEAAAAQLDASRALLKEAKLAEKSALAEYERQVADLREAIATRADAESGQALLPFNEGDTATVRLADDDSWKDHPLSAMGLPSAMLETLADSEVVTVGDIAKLGEDGRLVSDVVIGIGPAAQQTIDDALDKFWAEREQTLRVQVPTNDLKGICVECDMGDGKHAVGCSIGDEELKVALGEDRP